MTDTLTYVTYLTEHGRTPHRPLRCPRAGRPPAPPRLPRQLPSCAAGVGTEPSGPPTRRGPGPRLAAPTPAPKPLLRSWQ